MYPRSPGEDSSQNEVNDASPSPSASRSRSPVKVNGESMSEDPPGSPSCPVSSTSIASTPTAAGRAALLSPSNQQESRIPRLSGGGGLASPTSPRTPGTPGTPGAGTAAACRLGLRRSSSLRLRGEELAGLRESYHSPVASVSSTLTPRQHRRRTCHPVLCNHQEQRTLPVITDNECDSPRQRSLSLSLTPVRPRVVHAAPGGSSYGLADDSDAESVRSYGSACSTASACDHATIALNGTTWSGRSRKYVVHCSNHTGDNDQYLTPTQRAARQVRKFQALLKEARKEIEEKDREITRLTKEVVELRLYKASLNSPDERTDSSDCLTVRENNPFSPESPSKDLPEETLLEKAAEEEECRIASAATPESPEKRVQPDLPSSLADSGHFEDGSVHSKDSVHLLESQGEAKPCETRGSSSQGQDSSDGFSRQPERRALVDLYENRIENMHRRHIDETQDLKQKHNDKVESLLNQLSEVSTRYCEVRPSLDAAEARTRELEADLETVRQELAEQKSLFTDQEERHKQMYLKMYAKGQEAARIEQADKILENAHKTPPKVTVAELLQQLTVAQAELENMKDTSYPPEPHISADRSQSLLSAQEAVSLWVLGTRKAMYRRIVEVKSQQGALDPEITLQFLKSAIYYFLTDKENYQGHLNAIESILGFTEAEKHNIDRIHRQPKK